MVNQPAKDQSGAASGHRVKKYDIEGGALHVEIDEAKARRRSQSASLKRCLLYDSYVGSHY